MDYTKRVETPDHDDNRHRSNGGWSAIAAWAGLLLVAVAALVAFFQLRLGQRLRAEQAQPYDVIYAEHNAAHPHCIDLIVKNFGATAAGDITITIYPPLQRSAGGEIEEVKGPDQIRTLVPGQEWRTFWDSTIHREELGIPPRYTARPLGSYMSESSAHGAPRSYPGGSDQRFRQLSA